MTTLYWQYKMYRWKDNKNVHISSWDDVKDSDVKSRFKQRENQTLLDYNKSIGGVDKLDQFMSYYDVVRTGKKFWTYIFYTYFNIAINSFICFKKSKSTHAGYSLLYYKNSFTRVVNSYIVSSHIVYVGK